MRVLLYNEIESQKIPELKKVVGFLENNDFQSADVKKFEKGIYCARLNRADRLLFMIYQSSGQPYALIIEHIKNHAYDKSRFLKRGVKINEDLIPVLTQESIDKPDLITLPSPSDEILPFHFLQKPIAFDQTQQHIYNLPLPTIIIGTAGSGKTVLLLEKMKQLKGDVLYVTKSSPLSLHSQQLYYANHFSNLHQTVTFFSFQELLDSITTQPYSKVTYFDFKKWFARHSKATPIKDTHRLYEEFRGVITGSDITSAFLSRHSYLALGVKESLFAENERNNIYDLFERYLTFLSEEKRYDQNIISFEYLSLVKKQFDYVVIDEVQDISMIQLHLIMSTLTHPNHFLLCGDANQLIYPNFFSWAKVKSLFLKTNTATSPIAHSTTITQVLNTNYRNSINIITLANQLLRIKNWRFGSIDKDSHYEMKKMDYADGMNDEENGNITFLDKNLSLLRDINEKTRTSKQYAVIVLYDEMKAVAAEYFQTPLIFSVQECKGLEYENIILFNIVSCASSYFKSICQGVTPSVLNSPMQYARNKDKTDKSWEQYKFFINSLFVAITRAQQNLYWIEDDGEHPLLSLLKHNHSDYSADEMTHHTSSQEEWQQEASKLESQGKLAQAQHIRDDILKQHSPKWEVIAGEAIDELFNSALIQDDKKAKLALFEYALVYEDHEARNALIDIDFHPALHPEEGMQKLLKKYFMMYQLEQLDTIKRQMAKYGVDFRNPFNQTPLMIGAWLGNDRVIQVAQSLNADPQLANNKGFTASQIALEQACLHHDYANNKLQITYPILRPETTTILINNQLVKLNHQQIAFFVVQLMIALFYRILPENMIFTNGAYTAGNLANAIKHWPKGIIPEHFYDVSQLKGCLEAYCLYQTADNNPPLFIEVNTGNYLLNPDMVLYVEGEWLPVYEILLFDELTVGYQDSLGDLNTNTLYKNLLQERTSHYQELLGLNI